MVDKFRAPRDHVLALQTTLAETLPVPVQVGDGGTLGNKDLDRFFQV